MEQNESFLVIINTTLTSQTVSLNPQYVFVTIIDDDRKCSGNSQLSKHCTLYATSCLICLYRFCGATWCHCWECSCCHSSRTVCWRHYICIPLPQKKETHDQSPKDAVRSQAQDIFPNPHLRNRPQPLENCYLHIGLKLVPIATVLLVDLCNAHS